MFRKFVTRPNVVIVLLILQFVPLLMLPPDSFSTTTQEWWLPVLLAIFSLVAVYQLVIRRSTALWPWYLVSFSQGFNIISRLMLFMPHASENVGGVIQLNGLYVALSVASIIISTIYIWFSELPDVRMSLFTQKSSPSAS